MPKANNNREKLISPLLKTQEETFKMVNAESEESMVQHGEKKN